MDDRKKILERHLKYKDKTMDILKEDRNKKLAMIQNELRKKWLPEKYNPDLDKKNPL